MYLTGIVTLNGVYDSFKKKKTKMNFERWLFENLNIMS